MKDLIGAGSLRDVIAFPKTTAARALFEGAPTPVADDDLEALHLRLTEEAAERRARVAEGEVREAAAAGAAEAGSERETTEQETE